LKLYTPQRLQRRWLKIAPHVIDSILLGSAVVLMVQNSLYPTNQPWLLTKIIFLLLYIAFGLYTLRFAKTRPRVFAGFILSILCFTYIVVVALTKNPLPFV